MDDERAFPLPPKKGSASWSKWCERMAGFIQGAALEVRGREAMGKPHLNLIRGTDWLAVAIGNMGGVGKAAQVMGVSRQTIYNWLEDGVGGLAFRTIVELSQKGDVPLEYLARRQGPWVDREVER